MPDDAWSQRVDELGSLCAELGVQWLTLRAYEQGDRQRAVELGQWRHSVNGCDIVVDPCGDGRLVDLVTGIEPLHRVGESLTSVAAALYEPADSEPDLVVALGPPTQLPPSLVWELAYAELVFAAVSWSDLSADDLARAVADFSCRRRRFGGLDDDE